MRTLFAILLVAGAAPASAQTLVEHYVAAMEARGEADFATYLSEMEAAIQLEPGHPVIQFHLGRACANTDRPTEAFGWLRSAYSQGAWLDPDTDEWLAPLREEEGWPRLVALADSVGSHHGPGRVGFELQEFDLVPEGIAYDATTDRFYLGSIKRKIVSADRTGHTTGFIAPGQDGLLFVLGIRVDEERRRLWAVSVYDAAMADAEEAEVGASRLHCWSLETGELLALWNAPEDSLDHAFNDVALRPDGSAVLTDPGCGALFGASIGNGNLQQILPPGSLRGPNGIVIDPTGRIAYVSEYVYGVVRVDLAGPECVRLWVPEEIALVGVDGLYLHGNELVVVQNYAGLDRAAAFRLDESGTTIESVRVLEAHHPRMLDPTTGAIADGEFWYIANSNVARAAEATEEWGPVLVLRVRL